MTRPALPPHTSAYDRVAREYCDSRLSYPPRMLDWMMRSVGGRKRGLALDVGCGPGTLSIPLSRYFRKVLSVDASSGMLRQLAEQSQRQIQRPLPIRAVAEALPLARGSVRMAACSQSLHWMQSLDVLQELSRVLSSDGLVMLCWQLHMGPDTAPEVVYRQGWEKVTGAEPTRDPLRPHMNEAGALLGKPLDRWHREVVATYTPRSLAMSFLSREATGHLGDHVRQQLAKEWEERAGYQLGSRIPYVFTVEAALYRREALQSATAVRGA